MSCLIRLFLQDNWDPMIPWFDRAGVIQCVARKQGHKRAGGTIEFLLPRLLGKTKPSKIDIQLCDFQFLLIGVKNESNFLRRCVHEFGQDGPRIRQKHCTLPPPFETKTNVAITQLPYHECFPASELPENPRTPLAAQLCWHTGQWIHQRSAQVLVLRDVERNHGHGWHHV